MASWPLQCREKQPEVISRLSEGARGCRAGPGGAGWEPWSALVLMECEAGEGGTFEVGTCLCLWGLGCHLRGLGGTGHGVRSSKVTSDSKSLHDVHSCRHQDGGLCWPWLCWGLCRVFPGISTPLLGISPALPSRLTGHSPRHLPMTLQSPSAPLTKVHSHTDTQQGRRFSCRRSPLCGG